MHGGVEELCVWGETLGFLVEYPGVPVDSCWDFQDFQDFQDSWGLLGAPGVPGGVRAGSQGIWPSTEGFLEESWSSQWGDLSFRASESFFFLHHERSLHTNRPPWF